MHPEQIQFRMQMFERVSVELAPRIMEQTCDLSRWPAEILYMLFEHCVETIGLQRSLQARLVSSKNQRLSPYCNVCSFLSKMLSKRVSKTAVEFKASPLSMYTQSFDSFIKRALATASVLSPSDCKAPPSIIAEHIFAHISSTRAGNCLLAKITHRTVQELLRNRPVDERITIQSLRREYSISLCHLTVIQRGHQGALQLLTQPGQNQSENQSRADCLTAAAHFGNITYAGTLLRGGAQADQASPLFGWPLQVAAAQGHTALCQLLMRHGAHPKDPMTEMPLRKQNSEAVIGLGTALQAAAWFGCIETIRLFLRTTGNKSWGSDHDLERTVGSAVRSGNQEILDMLLYKSCKRHNRRIWRYILMQACEYNHPHFITRAVRLKTIPDFTKPRGIRWSLEPILLTPMEAAASRGHDTIVAQLLEKGAVAFDEEDIHGLIYPLELAARRGFVSVARVLLGDKPARGVKQIRIHDAQVEAARKGHAEFIEYLLWRGDTGPSQTAMRLAAQQSHWDVVRLLAAHGGDYSILWKSERIRSAFPWQMADQRLGSLRMLQRTAVGFISF